MMSLKQFLGTPFAEAEALSADLRWSYFAKGPGDENLPEDPRSVAYRPHTNPNSVENLREAYGSN